MGIVTVRDAADGMAEYFNGRLGNVFVVVRRARFSKVFDQPRLFLASLYILLWVDSRQGT